MPDTFFTASPDWGWLIVFYLFTSGITGACFFLAALLHLFGRTEDRPAVHTGYAIAFVGAVLCGVLLVFDLSRPLRFWHMLVQSNAGLPMFKGWSPMSVGSWVLTTFSLFATLAVAGAWAEVHDRAAWLKTLAHGWPGVVIAVLGGVLGLFLAGYSGVMLSVTNRPLWGDSVWLGGLFLSSAASAAAAAMVIAALWRGGSSPATLRWLNVIGRGALASTAIFLVAFVVSLGSAAQVLAGAWGLVLAAVLIGGVLVPLAIGFRQRAARGLSGLLVAAVLELAGSFLLRTIVTFSSNGVYAAGAGVHLP